MSYTLEIESSAERDMKKLATGVRKRVDAKIVSLADDPRPRGALKLVGYAEAVLRVRVGDYRIIYTVNDQARQVRVFGVKPRPKAYR